MGTLKHPRLVDQMSSIWNGTSNFRRREEL